MAAEYPPVYRRSHDFSRFAPEKKKWEASHQLNIECAKAIQHAVQSHAEGGQLDARPLLDQYGFERMTYVLANSLKPPGVAFSVSDDILEWSLMTGVPNDKDHSPDFTVQANASILESLIQQVWEARRNLGLFEFDQCVGGRSEQDFEGNVLVLNADALPPRIRSARNQLWYAIGGSGCRPGLGGCSLQGVCLGDGALATWKRDDFAGVLDEQYLPDWAAEKLVELRGSQDIQPEESSGGMEMK